MSDYLNSLVTRTLRLAPVVQPRPASLFEPVAPGRVDEAAFAVSENVATQEFVSRNQPAIHESFDLSVKKTERAFENAPSHTVLPTQIPRATSLPTQVTPAPAFLEGDWERKREVREQELSSSRVAETDSITSVREAGYEPTPSLIKPEVRIFSPVSDGEAGQPSLTTPPLAPVPANVTRAESLSRAREISAQAGAAEAPETVVVTIGRVDVRAIFAPPQAALRATRTQPQPLSLDEYLKQRSEGRR
jgi:hypothetical protein